MSEIKVNSIKGVGASTAAITVNNTDGTCAVNNTQRQGKNLIINGAMLVAQRATTYTGADNYNTVDRFKVIHSGLNEDVTSTQVDVSSGTTPYSLGFRKAWKITNGNQTDGAGTSDLLSIQYRVEAQDLASSGWDYKSTSSFITLSFWVKSSVAQSFGFFLRTHDGSQMTFPFETGTLSANTWTKITKTISGNGAISFNNDNGTGMEINISQFWGTDYTTSDKALDTWGSYSNDARLKDFPASTWYTTNDATFELTGVQLEVSDHATTFQHRSVADELQLCQRYYFKFCEGISKELNVAWYFTSTHVSFLLRYPTTMRAAPTLSVVTGTNYYILYRNGGNDQFNNFASEFISTEQMTCFKNSGVSGTAGQAGILRTYNSAAKVEMSAEL